ncbi:MAG: phosphoenolpyruvate synthase [Gammaproteobacteria bacterium]|nr:phosphoenolpyruvate synthase [Gammaproteobacteria bacterium]
MNFILRSRDAIRPEFAGAKAAALARLEESGIDVPPWVVIVPEAFLESLSVTQRAHYAAAKAQGRSFSVPAGLRPAPRVLAGVHQAVREICPSGESLAVRSSGVEEDGFHRSFAGQYQSFLFVDPCSVAEKIAAVWYSAFSERLLSYRRASELPVPGDPCAVLLQRMVDAEVSGVAFSADPLTGRRGVCVVAATPGTGEALVGGHCDGATWRVDRAGKIIEASAAGTMPGRHPLIDEEAVRRIAGLARRIAGYSGVPQDIEWAMAQGRLYVLQARPITALLSRADPDGRMRLWDNSNIVESYSGVTTPLTYSFARGAYECVYRRFCQIAGVPGADIAANEALFRGMIGLIRGRVYYNLMNWYRLLALIPGFCVNRRFMEQMMGVRSRLAAQGAHEIAALPAGSQLADLWRMVCTGTALFGSFLTLRRSISCFHAELADALRLPAIPLEEQEPDELASYYRTLELRLLARWGVPIVNDLFAMIFQGVLRHLCSVWLDNTKICSRLLECGDKVISIEPVRRIRELARLAAANPGLPQSLITGTPAEIRRAVHAVPDFEREYERYLERFQDRCLGELKLESPTVRDDPLPLLRTVGALAITLSAEDTTEAKVPDAEPISDAATFQRLSPLRRILFRWVLHHARARVADRENLRFERTRVFGLVRRIFTEFGRRFAALELIARPEDIFYLEVEEILGFVEGTATCTKLGELAAIRRREFEEYHVPAPSERFETHGSVYHGNDFFTVSPEHRSSVDGERQCGLGCSPGKVRGTVCVIRDPRHRRPKRGEIVVAPNTDPGWIVIFPLARGLIVERGSLLSHSAIVARELGLPAVVAVPGACDWLRDGDEVEMDGESGEIRRLHSTIKREAA